MESTDNQKDMTRRATLKGDWTSLDKKVDCPSIQHKRKPRCCRESMIVDFSKISGEFLKILNSSLGPKSLYLHKSGGGVSLVEQETTQLKMFLGLLKIH